MAERKKVNCYQTVQFILLELLIIGFSFHNAPSQRHITYMYMQMKRYAATQHLNDVCLRMHGV